MTGLSGARLDAPALVGGGESSSISSASIRSALSRATSAERSALFAGLVAAFIVAVEAIRWIRLDLLLDPERSWQLARSLLGLFVVAVMACGGIATAGLCLAVATSRWGYRAAVPLPVRRSSLLVLGGTVLLIGILLRVFGTGALRPLWIDDLSEMRPAIALRGDLTDFRSWSYPVPFREGRWLGSVGTLYLEFFRLCLKALGTTMAGVRAPSAIGGILSLLTAVLLGRGFLPRGGGVLTAIVLAGLRWSLIVSQWGWAAVVVAPVLDLAALSMLEARRRERLAFAALSGAVAGVGAHVHLVAWIAAAGLGLWALWPSTKASTARRTFLAGAFAFGFLLAALPLLRDDPFGRYFSRVAGRSRPLPTATIESRVWWSIDAAHDAMTGPWWTPDRWPRHDLPDRSRLGWVVGAALALALLRAILTPKDELSAYLLTSAAAALLSTLAWGRGGTPNSYRYSYLSSTTAIAAASGALWLLGAVPWPRRRATAYAVMGGFAISGALGARDAIVVWPDHPRTFAGFGGQDTLVGEAAARWDSYGSVSIDPSIPGDRIVIGGVRAFRLSPYSDPGREPAKPRALSFRIVPPDTQASVTERVIERITDDWGREWGIVLAPRRSSAPHRSKLRYEPPTSTRREPIGYVSGP